MNGKFESNPFSEAPPLRETVFQEQVLENYLEYVDEKLDQVLLLEVGGNENLSLADRMILVDMSKSYLGIDPCEPGVAAQEKIVTYVGETSGKRVDTARQYRLYETDERAHGYLLCENWFDPNSKAVSIKVRLFNREHFSQEDVMESLW